MSLFYASNTISLLTDWSIHLQKESHVTIPLYLLIKKKEITPCIIDVFFSNSSIYKGAISEFNFFKIVII